MEEDSLTRQIIGCCFEVHRELGPGFLEIYAKALQVQLKIQDLNFESEKEFNIYFQEQLVGKFRCDLLVENTVIAELKSVTGYIPKLFHAQYCHI